MTRILRVVAPRLRGAPRRLRRVRPRPPAALAAAALVLLAALACTPAGPAPGPAPAEEAPEAAAERPDDDTLVRARSLLSEGRSAAALHALLGLPADVPEAVRDSAGVLAAAAARTLTTDSLEVLAGRPRPGGPDAAPGTGAPARAAVLGELALALHLEGREEEARGLGREAAAQDEGPGGRVARAVLEGRTDEVAPPAVLGAVLPLSGSPSFQRYARLIEDGARAAVSRQAPRLRRPLRLEVGDDAGTPSGAGQALREVAGAGLLGFVGPLMGRSLPEAAGARGAVVPIVSPTARSVPDGLSAVYSLLGFDPGAALAAAEYATGSGLRTAVVVRPEDPTAADEAAAFRRALEAGGGRVLRELTYVQGSTDFGAVLEEVDSLRPGLLFLPLTPEDVPLLAPQLTFHGLDSLGVQMIGGGAWTEPSVMEELDPRHLEAVGVATPRLPGERHPGFDDFVAAFEATHRRSLRSDVPAYGYDAAALILEAARRAGSGPDGGRPDPDALVAAFESITDFPGATGVLSVEDGRIVRRHTLVVFEEGRARALVAGEVPALDRRDHLREERERRREREEGREGPTRPRAGDEDPQRRRTPSR